MELLFKEEGVTEFLSKMTPINEIINKVKKVLEV